MTANDTPKTLEPGAYWYVAPGEAPKICEKRDGEDYVRFTNGGRQSWVREGDSFVGPLMSPAQLEQLAFAVESVQDKALDAKRNDGIDLEYESLEESIEYLVSLTTKQAGSVSV